MLVSMSIVYLYSAESSGSIPLVVEPSLLQAWRSTGVSETRLSASGNYLRWTSHCHSPASGSCKRHGQKPCLLAGFTAQCLINWRERNRIGLSTQRPGLLNAIASRMFPSTSQLQPCNFTSNSSVSAYCMDPIPLVPADTARYPANPTPCRPL